MNTANQANLDAGEAPVLAKEQIYVAIYNSVQHNNLIEHLSSSKDTSRASISSFTTFESSELKYPFVVYLSVTRQNKPCWTGMNLEGFSCGDLIEVSLDQFKVLQHVLLEDVPFTPKTGDWIDVSNDKRDWETRIFLASVPALTTPILAVSPYDIDVYKAGGLIEDPSFHVYMRPATKTVVTMKQIAEFVGVREDNLQLFIEEV